MKTTETSSPVTQENTATGRQLQIGVMGSAADLKYENLQNLAEEIATNLKYDNRIQDLAEETGYWIAKNGATLLFGAEKDYDSLSTAACRGAKRGGGTTVGVTYGKGLNDTYEKENVDVIIASAQERGGGREAVLVTSCDGVIAISGGSGTLTEMAIAYQASRPIVALQGTGGWSDKLAGQYLDARNRILVEVAKSPKEAVELIIARVREMALWKYCDYSKIPNKL